MADDPTIDNGALTDFVVSADQTGGVGYIQRMKLCYSADGDATHILADANGLEVQLGAALPAGTNNIGDVDIASAIPTGGNVIGIVQTHGDVDHDVGNTLETSQVGGHASPPFTAPAVVATGDRVRAWYDRSGAAIQRSAKLLTYRAVFRGTARPYNLTNVFAGAGRKQFATMHHAVGATKTVRLRQVLVGFQANTAADDISVDLVRITTAPATGNPAITSSEATSNGASAEVTCLALPTTGATEEAQPYSWVRAVLGVTAAAPVENPPPSIPWIELYSDKGPDNESHPPTILAGVAEGWAVTVDSNTASTIGVVIMIEFTEE